MECLKCHRISTVGNAIPDIDGEGSLGCPFCYDKDLERVALVEQPPSDSEQGEFRKTHFDEIKANAYGMETPQFCGWLYTVIYDSYAEIDRLTEEIFNIKRLCNYYDEFGEVSQPDYVLPDLADNVMGIFAELQQRIQQLEAKLAEFRAYNEGDNAIVVIEQLEKELAEAKDELENYKLEHSRRCGEIRDLKDELEQAKKTK
ncbi:MAG: hypothetical protein PHQ00_06665, partial [Phycisphaerae bacterium]|nr:hypothetical protein [Phycisphaerae bacterium]